MLYVYIYIYKLERYSFRIFEIKLDVKIKATQVSNSISINVTRKLDYTHKKKKDKCYFEIKLIVTVVCEVYLLIHLRAILRYTVTTYHSHSNMQAILAMQKRGISDKNEKREGQKRHGLQRLRRSNGLSLRWSASIDNVDELKPRFASSPLQTCFD